MRLALVVIFLVVWGLGLFALHSRWQEKQRLRLAEHTSVVATTYRASIAMFHLTTETFIRQVVQRPDVLETFARGLRGTEAQRSQARGELYRRLAAAYADLDQHGVHQLHFHSSESHSFLRFHAPDKFGDALSEIRPSVGMVNRDRQAIFGFEIGRFGLGFRYLYPLLYQEQHLGSVETGVTFRAISEAMARIDPGREYLLTLRRDLVERKVFSDQRKLYIDSPVHADFLIEDPSLKIPGAPRPAIPVLRQLNEQLRRHAEVQSGMLAGASFSLALSHANDDWAVSFVPAENISGENVAYLVAYSHFPVVAELRREYYASFVLLSLVLAGLAGLSWRLLGAHRTLRRDARQLQAITETIADGLYVMEHGGQISLVNPAFENILGYRADEIVGRVGHDLFHVHDGGRELPQADCPIIQATQKGASYHGEELFRHKNGQLLTVELDCQPLNLPDGTAGSVTAFRDISERKAAQLRLLESDRIKGEFIATASHELRTPLTVIQGYLELLLTNEELSADQVHEIETVVYDKALALERIVEDLLDVSRIEAGRPIHLDYNEVDMVREISTIVAQFRKESPRHRFALRLPEQPVVLSIDKFKIVQVLENLLNNAVKFSPPDTEIRLSGEQVGDRFELRISDQGIGILPEDQAHIFDKFHRVDNSDTAVGGFGLGLYLAKRIVEAHAGELQVESELGQGATFTLSLPLPDAS
ncbi:MAG: ATP-binding protein [Desulfuromonadales bacterium]|nr:ATP-binding protein [Desulfuromonadales bacterium]